MQQSRPFSIVPQKSKIGIRRMTDAQAAQFGKREERGGQPGTGFPEEVQSRKIIPMVPYHRNERSMSCLYITGVLMLRKIHQKGFVVCVIISGVLGKLCQQLRKSAYLGSSGKNCKIQTILT